MTPQEQLSDIVKTTPPLAVTSMSICGFPMSDWVLLLTALYTILQIGLIARRFVVMRRATDITCVKDCPNRMKNDNP